MTTATLDANQLSRDLPAPGLLGLAERGWLPDAAIRELMLNPTATSLDYMPAIDVLRAHGLTICR